MSVRAANVREYNESEHGYKVTINDRPIQEWERTERYDMPEDDHVLVVTAWRDQDIPVVEIDLLDLLKWVKKNRPELLT
jgi:hypothetical protein